MKVNGWLKLASTSIWRSSTGCGRSSGTESIRETISAAFREVIRMAAVRDLVALGESGAFDFLLEPGAEERMWG